MYGVTRKYCSAVMLCPVLVLAPVMCILSGTGVYLVLSISMKNLDISHLDKKGKKHQDSIYSIKNKESSGMMLVIAFFLDTYTSHSAWVYSEALVPIILSACGCMAIGSLLMTSEKPIIGFLIILQRMQMSCDGGIIPTKSAVLVDSFCG